MDEDKYITEVYARVEDNGVLENRHPDEAANQLVQAPYRHSNEETTWLYAVPEELGGGTRLDPVDVLKHSPNPMGETALDGELLRGARERLATDLRLAEEGKL